MCFHYVVEFTTDHFIFPASSLNPISCVTLCTMPDHISLKSGRVEELAPLDGVSCSQNVCLTTASLTMFPLHIIERAFNSLHGVTLLGRLLLP